MQLRYAVLLVLASADVSGAQTQMSTDTTKLRGRVIDSVTRVPIGGVEISLANLRRVSDSAGRFTFTALPSGRHVVQVRHVGYLAKSETLSVSMDDSAEHLVALGRVPVQLEEVVIAGKPVTFPRFFKEAYQRAARGHGVYFTREDIDRANAVDYKTLLSTIPGVSANDRGVSFDRCQSELLAAQFGKLRPKVQVYVDGFRITLDADDFRDIYSALSTVKPQRIQIMEVYPNVSSIPAEFLADACAVVVIWTKRD